MFYHIFQSSPVATAVISLPGGSYVDLNPAAERLLGASRAELMERPETAWEQMLTPVARAELLGLLAAQGRVLEYPCTLTTRAGAPLDCLLSVEPLELDGQAYAVVSIVDASAQRQAAQARDAAEEALRQTRTLFTRLFHASPIATTLTSLPERRFLDLNAAAEDLMGYPRESLLGQAANTFPFFADPEERQQIDALLAGEGRLSGFEARLRTASGAERVCLFSAEIVSVEGAQYVLTQLVDISARKEAELALHASKEHYRSLLQSVDTGIAVVDGAGRFLYLNELAAAQRGGSVEALTGKTIAELFPEPIASQQLAGIRQVIREDRGLVREIVSVKDGQPNWFRISIQPIHDAQGQVVSTLVNATDIHHLKTVQQELQDLNQTLEERVRQRAAEVQDLYDHAPTGYYSTDADNRITRINQTLLDWLGYTREEVLGRQGNDFLAPEIRDAFVAQIPALKQRGQVQGLDARLRRKDGSSFPVLLSVTSIYGADGAYVGNRATVFDNTERKQAEDALRESEEQNRVLFEESPAAVALFDRQDRIVRANRAFAQLVGYPLERLQEQQVDGLGLLSHAQLAQLVADMAPTLKHGSGFAEAVVTFTRANGEPQVVEVRAFALTIHGQWHSLVSAHDITRERKTEETLRRANAELARAARAKDEFLANMSHELRTPINAILAYSESLQDAVYDPLTKRQHGAIDAVEGAGHHLLTLINDILDLAKVESGRLELHTERVAVRAICQTSLLFVHEQALKKHMRLSLGLNEDAAMIEVDPVRLKQMLVNLLSNAVKFTPDGGAVRLEVRVDRADGVAQFVVADTGIGIAPEDIGRLFQPFSQVDAALDRAYEGTGLGLALVRRLTELHGGSVTVESAVGQGSRFTITLPYHDPLHALPRAAKALPPHPAESEAALAEAQRGRVLLAEDNEANSDSMNDYLRAKGYDVVVVRDGHEALVRADTFHPQIILMDIQMPGMDGLEAIRRLRALPRYAATPIIALTALAMPGDKERCLAAGATLYLTKPVRLSNLVGTMQQLLGR